MLLGGFVVSCGDDDNSDGSPEKNVQDKVFTVNGVSFRMVYVKRGTFQMGSDNGYKYEKPVHQVTLSKDFYIGETEVTQELWSAVMGSNPSNFTGNMQHPVEMVSWNDCQTFISKLNKLTGETFCLPTEAQWEYAARGGNLSKGFLYSGGNAFENVAWYNDNSNNTTHPVKTKNPNELGIYDMSGNVGECCSDWYGSYTSVAQTDPTGPDTGIYRVRRGGAWDDCAADCHRVNIPPTFRGSCLGLRLAH